jgi:hypothetical protein
MIVAAFIGLFSSFKIAKLLESKRESTSDGRLIVEDLELSRKNDDSSI